MLGDKPMIQWVWERASESFGHLVVATDDKRIMEAVNSFGGKAVMTSPDHRTGTERCAEALDQYITATGVGITHVVNIQGDEPLLQPSQLEAIKACLLEPGTEVATLVRPISDPADLDNPNVVKVVIGSGSRALYFSRLPVPYSRDEDPVSMVRQGRYLCHIGLYGYLANVLRDLVRLPVSSLEQAESLEQLRWLENGIIIRTRTTTESSMGVDTPEDLEALKRML